jgi:hypothetical protein
MSITFSDLPPQNLKVPIPPELSRRNWFTVSLLPDALQSISARAFFHTHSVVTGTGSFLSFAIPTDSGVKTRALVWWLELSW